MSQSAQAQELLSRIEDVRARQRSLLACILCAVVSGAKGSTQIGEWIGRMSPAMLRRLRCRRTAAGQYVWPSESTVRRLLQKIPVDSLEEALGGWLQTQAAAGAAGNAGSKKNTPRSPSTARRCAAPMTDKARPDHFRAIVARYRPRPPAEAYLRLRTGWVESPCSSGTGRSTAVGEVVHCNVKFQLSPGGSTMSARQSAVVVLASVLLLTACGITTVALVPGANKVRVASNAQDLTACTAVGNVRLPPSSPKYGPFYANPIDELRNQTVGLGGNTLFVTDNNNVTEEGVAYRCP